MTKSIVVYILTIAMVAGGIIAALPFIPTMHYSLAEWAVTHRLDLIGSAIACFVVGLLFTRRFVLGFMLALASPIFFWGVFLSLNGALDKHPGMTEKFIVVLKDKEYIENGNNPGYWNY